MDASAIRSRLADSGGRLYWRSLGELADTPGFREYLHREFPEQASEWNDPKGRREFLKLMSASLALAGVGACTKQPPEAIVPYVRQPEDLVPGRPLFFASAIPFSGIANPVLVESHMGRPTKIEGNPDHPASLGATDAMTQAAVLGLYDPDRAQIITYRGQLRTWSDFRTALTSTLAEQKALQGAGLRILSGPVTSPSLAELMATVLAAYPKARWHQYDPVSRDGARAAARRAAGRPGETVYHFDKADVILSLDADFLACGPGSVRYARDFADRRRVSEERKTMNRLYAVESTPSLTGLKADHRLPVRASDVEGFARQIAAGIGVGSAGAGGGDVAWIAAVAKDLQAHRGTSLVVAGEYQPVAVHALAHAMNQALGNVGATVTYGPAIEAAGQDQAASMADLATAIDGGKVDLLVILGGNPVFSAPADLKFADRLMKVPLSVYHGLYVDETADLCHWNVADTHPLESWGDGRAFDGTVTLIQPLIAPLYEGRSAHEVVSTLAGQSGRSQLDIVKDYWTRAFAGQAWSFRDAEGKPFSNADQFWKHALHDGFIRGTSIADGGPATPFVPAPAAAPTTLAIAGATAATGAPPAAAPAAPPQPEPAAAPSAPEASPAGASPAPAAGLEIIFRPDPTVWDGRFANNGWLQELPKPLTKVTWDATAWLHPSLADQHSLRDGDVIELRYRGNTARMPIFRVGGHPRQSVTVFFGYGRRKAGRVGNAEGMAQQFNPFLLRTSDAPWFGTGLEISKTGDRHLIATTQEHHLMEGRSPVRVAGLEEYLREPKIIAEMGEKPARTLTLVPEYRVHRLQVGHGDRPHVLHRLRGMHDGLRRGEQHPGCRQGPGLPGPRDALDSRRSLLHGRSGARGHGAIRPPAGAVHAVRERAVRARLPGCRDDAQHRRPQRHGLQPVRRNAVLLEQLPVQGPPVQLPALSGLGHAKPVSLAEPGRHGAEPRRHGEVHLLRAAHQSGAHRLETGRAQDSRRRDRHRLPGSLPGRRDCLRRPQRSEQPGREAQGTGAQLRPPRRAEHATPDDVPRGAEKPQP